MSPILVKADISTQILNFLRTNSREEISSSLLPVYTHAEIYSEVKLVKKSLSIKKRNPKNCSKDKKVALEFLIFLLSTYKNEKVVFVTDKAISSSLEVSSLAKRVEILEREIGVKRKRDRINKCSFTSRIGHEFSCNMIFARIIQHES